MVIFENDADATKPLSCRTEKRKDLHDGIPQHDLQVILVAA